MNTYPTPAPIRAVIDIGVGDITVTASDRGDAVVMVRPRDDSKQLDIEAASGTFVDFSDGTLTIRTLRTWKRFTGPTRNDGAVSVQVELPSDSALDAKTGMGRIDCEGELSDAVVKTGMGDARLDSVRSLEVRAGLGDVVVDVVGNAKVSTASGVVRLGSIRGFATVKNSNGNVEVAEADRDIHIRTASGDIRIGRALGTVNTSSAAGEITIAEVSAGSVNARSSAGAITIGIREGTAAWLDVESKYGAIRNGLDMSTGPSGSESTVEVRARTGAGDIIISRSGAA